jgi:hypothetical protein
VDATYREREAVMEEILEPTQRAMRRAALIGALSILALTTPLAAAEFGEPNLTPADPIAASSPNASEEAQAPAEINRYLIVDGDSMSGSWDSRDEQRINAWRTRYGSKFAWFRRSGHDYIVTDDKTLAEIREAMSPQKEVSAKQAEVNRAQAEVNRHQAKVNGYQDEVNRAQAQVNARQRTVGQSSREGATDTSAQLRVNEMQSEVNARQNLVNAEQHDVNAEQHVINDQQEIVSQIQKRVSKEIQRSLARIFEAGFRTGLAREAD